MAGGVLLALSVSFGGLTYLSMRVTAGVRSLVAAEAGYALAQEKAAFHLTHYVVAGGEDRRVRFEAEARRLAEVRVVGPGQGDARTGAASIDRFRARLAAGRLVATSAGDAASAADAVWFFRLFRTSALLEPAFARWAEADAAFERLVRVGRTVRPGASPEETVQTLRAVEVVDEELDAATARLTATLGRTARTVERTSWGLALAGTLLALLLAAAVVSRLFGRLSAALGLVEQVLEHSRDAIHVSDQAGRFLLVNPAARALYGLGPGRLLPVDAAAHGGRRAVEATLAADGVVRDAEVVVTAPDGRARTCLESATVLKDSRGRPALRLAVLRDVTEARAAEADLLASRRHTDRLALAAAQTDNGVVVTDVDGRTEWVNDGFTRLTGYSLGEMRGRTPGAVLQGADTDPQTVRDIRESIQARRPFAAEVVNYRKDGTPYWVWIEATPIVEGNEITGYMAIETDVSAKRQTAQALRVSEARYRSVVESVRDVVFQTDVDGRWTFLNPAWETVTGLPVAATLGRSSHEAFHADDRDRHDEASEALLADDTGFARIETRLLSARGERCAEVHAQLLRDDTGAVIGTTGTIVDITDTVRFAAERNARGRTEEMLRLKGALLDNMSHELRTPLTAILGFSEILEEELAGDPQDHAAIIAGNARRLMATLNSVIDLARLEGGTVEITLEPVDVFAAAREVLDLHRRLADDRGLGLSLDGLPTVAWVDRAAFTRLLANLVCNAIKFTEHGGVAVDIRPADTDGRGVEIRVADTGIGIPQAFLPRLFRSFEQASEGHDRTHEGAGLGLAISKKLADLMGGGVRVESRLGHGTTFTVALPAPVFRGDSSGNATLPPTIL